MKIKVLGARFNRGWKRRYAGKIGRDEEKKELKAAYEDGYRASKKLSQQYECLVWRRKR